MMGTTEPGAPPVNGLLAYHGSPHSFDRFDINKMGSGEGNQQYGRASHPQAGNEATARHYRDLLSAPDLSRPSGSSGHMYQVQIAADPEHFLDWDRPLNEQHPVVQDAHRSILEPYRQQLMNDFLPSWREPTPEEIAETNSQASATIGALRGGQAYGKIGLHDPVAASQSLQASGVPGLRYLDAGSRDGSGSGSDPSHNFVVFNDQNLQILKKYGIAGLGIGGAAATQSQVAPSSDYAGQNAAAPAATPQY